MSSFVDGQGHYVQFGDPWQDEDGRWYSPGDSFRDGRGNWISWGDSFQDASGVWRNWGESFIDYSGHYAYPPHKQDYSYLNALILDDDDDYDHSDYDNEVSHTGSIGLSPLAELIVSFIEALVPSMVFGFAASVILPFFGILDLDDLWSNTFKIGIIFFVVVLGIILLATHAINKKK